MQHKPPLPACDFLIYVFQTGEVFNELLSTGIYCLNSCRAWLSNVFVLFNHKYGNRYRFQPTQSSMTITVVHPQQCTNTVLGQSRRVAMRSALQTVVVRCMSEVQSIIFTHKNSQSYGLTAQTEEILRNAKKSAMEYQSKGLVLKQTTLWLTGIYDTVPLLLRFLGKMSWKSVDWNRNSFSNHVKPSP